MAQLQQACRQHCVHRPAESLCQQFSLAITYNTQTDLSCSHDSAKADGSGMGGHFVEAAEVILRISLPIHLVNGGDKGLRRQGGLRFKEANMTVDTHAKKHPFKSSAIYDFPLCL